MDYGPGGVAVGIKDEVRCRDGSGFDDLHLGQSLLDSISQTAIAGYLIRTPVVGKYDVFESSY